MGYITKTLLHYKKKVLIQLILSRRNVETFYRTTRMQSICLQSIFQFLNVTMFCNVLFIYSPTGFCNSEKISTASCQLQNARPHREQDLKLPPDKSQWIKPGVFSCCLYIVRRTTLPVT